VTIKANSSLEKFADLKSAKESFIQEAGTLICVKKLAIHRTSLLWVS